MSSLSNQPSGSPFPDYTELCTSAAVPPQTWDWQRPAAMDVGTPRGLMVGGRAGLTDEDKLCFFEQPRRAGVELQVPGKTAGIFGSVSLGSAGDSPDSPLSSSPSPSPASPGRMPSALACGATARVPLPPVPGSPVRQLEAPAAPTAPAAPDRGSDAPPSPWSSSSLGESSPKVAMPQVAPNYCVIGTLEEDSKFGTGAAEELLGAPEFSQGSSGDDSEEEGEEEEELEPCFMGRAEQQRKAMRRAMSECSHLSVPTSLELPDTYPGGMPAGVDTGVSPTGGLRRSPNFMKRSLTVSEDQPPTPPPTLSAAGATQTDLRLTPPEPRLRLPPFPPLKDGPSPFPGSPLDSPPQGFMVEKELGGIVLPVPASPKTFASSGGSDDDDEDLDEDLDEDSRVDVRTGLDFASSSRPTVAGVAFSGGRGYDGHFTTSSYTSLGGLNHKTNPFITLDGRWRPGWVLLAGVSGKFSLL